jgi:hypothetical protein
MPSSSLAALVPGSLPETKIGQYSNEEIAGLSAAQLGAVAARALSAAAPLPGEYVPEDESEIVTVTHGYGRVPHNWRNRIDRVLFIGGVARRVPYKWVKAVRKEAPGTVLHVFKHDATPVEFARVSGITPELMTPTTQAALLGALQPTDIVGVLGREESLRIAEALLHSASDADVQKTSGGVSTVRARTR